MATNGVPEQASLLMWVVYAHVSPYPRSYQARQVRVTRDGPVETGEHAVGPLDVLRGYLSEHQGLTRLDRSPDDHPSIVETWL